MVELERLHSLDEHQELQEGQPHLLRVVVQEGVEQGEELLQEGVAQVVLNHKAQALEHRGQTSLIMRGWS